MNDNFSNYFDGDFEKFALRQEVRSYRQSNKAERANIIKGLEWLIKRLEGIDNENCR